MAQKRYPFFFSFNSKTKVKKSWDKNPDLTRHSCLYRPKWSIVKKREREISTVDSFPKFLNQPNWGRRSQELGSQSGSPPREADAVALALSHCLPGPALAGSWNESRAWIQTQAWWCGPWAPQLHLHHYTREILKEALKLLQNEIFWFLGSIHEHFSHW